MGEERLLDRVEWLRFHGFRDPFPENSLRGSEDPLLNSVLDAKGQIIEKFNVGVFVEPRDMDIVSVLRTAESPGIRFIFAPAGGGKSSICRYIKYRFDEARMNSPLLGITGEPKNILAVEYAHHDFEKRKIKSHIVEIVELVKREAIEREVISRSQELDVNTKQSEENILRELILRCREHNLQGVCVLVDEIDRKRFEPAMDFLARGDLFSVSGMIFKFFLPIEVLDLAKERLYLNNKYAYGVINWKNQEDLRNLLKLRLRSCLIDYDDKQRDDQSSEGYDRFKSLFSDETRANWQGFPDEFVSLALEMQNPTPRYMWLFGFRLIQRHFDISRGYRQPNELIEYTTFNYVRNQMLNDLSKSKEEPDQIVRRPAMKKTADQIKIDVSGGSLQINVGGHVEAIQENMLPSGFVGALADAKKIIADDRELPQPNKEFCLHRIEEMEREASAGKPTEKIKDLGKGLLAVLKSMPELLKVVAMLEPFISKIL